MQPKLLTRNLYSFELKSCQRISEILWDDALHLQIIARAHGRDKNFTFGLQARGVVAMLFWPKILTAYKLRRPKSAGRVKIKHFGFRIQPPLPHRLAPNSVCRWSLATAFEMCRHVSFSKIPTSTGESLCGREWRLNQQP